MGRPPTKPIKFRDGFYLEIRNRGANSGIKLHRTTKEQMLRTIKDYEQSKDVIILGESKNGKWVNKTPIVHVVEN
jgi:predicted transcriptional regulator